MKFYRLDELAEATGVTPRTIRYYVAEGLLPSPQGAGPATVYTVGHRDRLLLIGQLKARGIPLRDIRRRIAPLSDAKVRAELASYDASIAEVGASTAPDTAGERAHETPPSGPLSPYPAPVPAESGSNQSEVVHEHWERIILAEGIELHIRADRRQDGLLVATLLRHARTLLDEP